MNLFFKILETSVYTKVDTTISEPTATLITPSTSDFAYTVYDLPGITSGYRRRSAFSVLQINTNATEIAVKAFVQWTATISTMMSIYDENWNFITTVHGDSTSEGFSTRTATLTGSGFRRFYIVEGGIGKENNIEPKGQWISTIEAVTGTIEITLIPKNTNRIVAVGDSILVGAVSSLNSRYGWIPLLRGVKRAQDWSVSTYGFGSASTMDMFLTDEYQQVGAQDVFDNLTGATGRKVLIWVLGTNDFNYGKDPNDMAIAAGNVWDKVYALDSTIEIICVTPLLRGDNSRLTGIGDWSIIDHRNALTTAANSRAYVTVYDGEPIIASADLVDQVHPNDVGHQKVADYMASIL